MLIKLKFGVGCAILLNANVKSEALLDHIASIAKSKMMLKKKSENVRLRALKSETESAQQLATDLEVTAGWEFAS